MVLHRPVETGTVFRALHCSLVTWLYDGLRVAWQIAEVAILALQIRASETTSPWIENHVVLGIADVDSVEQCGGKQSISVDLRNIVPRADRATRRKLEEWIACQFVCPAGPGPSNTCRPIPLSASFPDRIRALPDKNFGLVASVIQKWAADAGI